MTEESYECFRGGFELAETLERARNLARKLENPSSVTPGAPVYGRNYLLDLISSARKELELLNQRGCLSGANEKELAQAEDSLKVAYEYSQQYVESGGAPYGLEFELHFAERILGGKTK